MLQERNNVQHILYVNEEIKNFINVQLTVQQHNLLLLLYLFHFSSYIYNTTNNNKSMISRVFYILIAIAIQIPPLVAFTPVLSSVASKHYQSQGQSSSTSSSVLFSTKSNEEYNDDLADVAFVLLAGGTGSRMKANMPKQFLELKGMPILHHSLDLFLNKLPAYAEEKGMR